MGLQVGVIMTRKYHKGIAESVVPVERSRYWEGSQLRRWRRKRWYIASCQSTCWMHQSVWRLCCGGPQFGGWCVWWFGVELRATPVCG